MKGKDYEPSFDLKAFIARSGDGWTGVCPICGYKFKPYFSNLPEKQQKDGRCADTRNCNRRVRRSKRRGAHDR